MDEEKVDPDSIDRIRDATFPVARRGYDKREVDRFLTRVADWLETGGGDQVRAELVRRDLDRVGKLTSRILTEAQKAAEKLTADAEVDADGIRAGADSYAARVRAEADEHAREARAAAEQEAVEAISSAQAEAKRMVDEAGRRRTDIETLITDLERRRDAVVGELERLSAELIGAAAEHRPGAGAEPEPHTEVTTG